MGGRRMLAAERARVFEAFYRTPDARAEGVRSHGVGLALAAVAAMAGWLVRMEWHKRRPG